MARLAAIVALYLAGMAAQAAAQSTAQTIEPGVIKAIEIEPTSSDRVEIRIFAGTELDLVGVRVNRDDLLALQIPRHFLGPGVEDLYPSDGLIRAVRSRVEQTPRGPLTLIEISLRRPAAYDLSADDGRLRLRIWPQDGESPEAALRRQTTELESALTASERTRNDLISRLEELERGKRDQDVSLTATLSEVTEVLRGLRAKTEELTVQLGQAGTRESELSARVAQLEASLAESEKARADLAAAVSNQTSAAPAPITRTPTVQLGNISPEGLEAAPTMPPPALEEGPTDPAIGTEAVGAYRFIVAASMPEQRPAMALAASLRGRGYASVVYWSDSGFYVVTLGYMLRAEAERLLDRAIRKSDVAADAYLIYGTSLQSKVDP